MRCAALVAGMDLRRRLRNRSFVLQAFVGPLLLATIISAAFGGGFAVEIDVGVVDADRSELTSQIVAGLTEAEVEGVTFVPVRDDELVRRMVTDGAVASAVVIPSGFADSLARPEPLPLGVVTSSDSQLGSAVAQSVAQEVAARASTGRLAVAAATTAGVEPPAAERLASSEPAIGVAVQSPGEEQSPAAHFGPGMGLLFLFLTVGLVARGLIDEQRRHLLDRIRAAPVSMPAILVGRCVAVVAIGVVSLVVIWVSTTLLLGARWGDPLGVLALIVASALSVAGVAGLVASAARTEQSADTLATMAAFGLSLVGGSMIPIADMPDAMARISLLTPNGWSLSGFAELSAGDGSLADVLPHVGVLCGWAVAMGAVAALVLPRRLGAR